ncbi:hypothetical protein [Streptomyces virginiae]|uniref:hypothetical protein n=1 Tax=Streptomyces virginiae TaxID=1961 RepID=UPI00345273E8
MTAEFRHHQLHDQQPATTPVPTGARGAGSRDRPAPRSATPSRIQGDPYAHTGGARVADDVADEFADGQQQDIRGVERDRPASRAARTRSAIPAIWRFVHWVTDADFASVPQVKARAPGGEGGATTE